MSKPSLSRSVLNDKNKWYVIEFTNESVDIAPDFWIIASKESNNDKDVRKYSVYWPKKRYQSYKITGFLANRSSPKDFEHSIYKLKRVFWESGNSFFSSFILIL